MDERKAIKLDFWKCIEYLRPKAVAVICLLVIGQKNFMLPALIIVSGILLFVRKGGESSLRIEQESQKKTNQKETAQKNHRNKEGRV